VGSAIDGIPDDETTAGYIEFVRARVDAERWVHSIETAKLAVELALRHGESPSRAAIAGAVHDIARPLSDDELVAAADGLDDISRVERRFPVLLHGPVAARMLRDQMACDDDELMFAVRHHTCGHPALATLGKCLMVADYAEPSRDFPGVDEVRDRLGSDLDRVLLRVIDNRIAYARESGWAIDPRSEALRNVLRQRIVEP